MTDAHVTLPECRDAVARGLDQESWSHTTSRFRSLDHDFAVRCTDPALGRYLERIFAEFAVSGKPRTYYSVVGRPQGNQHYSVFFGHELLQTSPLASGALAMLLWHVNHEAVASCREHILLHASAAEYNGSALLFPAPMESGKTTLVAGLVRAGLRYLTDEVVAIDPYSHRVRPFPKALSVDMGSWKVLADLEPVVEPEMRPYLTTQWQVDPRSIRADVIAPRSSPRFIILPSYRQGAATKLTRLRRAQALLALCENSFNLEQFGSRGLKALAAVVRQSECYELISGDLKGACDVVLRLCHAVRDSGGD